MFESVKLSEFSEANCTLVRPATNTRPAIWHIQEDGVQAVIKAFNENKFFFRNTLGRFLVWREAKAYRELKNIKGIPTLFRVIDGLALVIEDIPGIDLGKIRGRAGLKSDFFEALTDLVTCIHERGMAHCDLKKAGNIVLGQDGRPYVIDWASAISKKGFRLPLLKQIYDRFVQDDNNAIIKHKLVHAPWLVVPEEQKRYSHRSCTERVVRAIRDKLRHFLQAVV